MFATLLYAKKSFKLAETMESDNKNNSTDNNKLSADKTKNKLPKIFWIYTIFIFFSAAGFVNYQIISYHIEKGGLFTDIYLPALYSLAMAVDAVAALITGRIYDKKGLKTLISIPIFTILIPLFAFFSNMYFLVTSVILWGALMGIHETIMRAAIADMTPPESRGTAYGIFNTVYGVAFFIGGLFVGYLYDISVYLIITYVAIISLLIFIIYYKYLSTDKAENI
jgi:predicted MFS family arabinose efflux permease